MVEEDNNDVGEIIKKYNISADDILSKKKLALPNITGIYFLINKNEIVYVGKSVDINGRILVHNKNILKTFDSFSILECPVEFLNILESHYIFKFHPFLNNQSPNTSAYATFAQLRKLLAVNLINLTEIPTPALKLWMKFKRINYYQDGYYRLSDFQDFEDFKLWLQKIHHDTYQCPTSYVRDYFQEIKSK